jgi:hypothetical protein
MRIIRAGIIAAFAAALVLSQAAGIAQQADKVFWMNTTEVPLANLTDYHAFAEQELMPLMEKHGYDFVAAWQTIVGDIEEVIVVAEFENMAAYHDARRSLTGSDEWAALSKKMYALMGDKAVKTKFLSATPYSPLQ